MNETIPKIFCYPFLSKNGFYVFFPKEGKVFSFDRILYSCFSFLSKYRATKKSLYAYLLNQGFLRGYDFNKKYQFLLDFIKRHDVLPFKSNVESLRKDAEQSFSNFLKKHKEGKVQKPTITIYISDKCNSMCAYCPFKGDLLGKERHSGDSSLDISAGEKAIKDYLSVTRNSGMEEINIELLGGEPLIKFDSVRALILFAEKYHGLMKHKAKMVFRMTTNGLLLNEENVKFFIAHKVYLTISLDGPEAIHDKYRKKINGEKTYFDVIEKVKLLKDLSLAYCFKNDYFAEHVSFNATLVDKEDRAITKAFFKKSKIFDSLKGKRPKFFISDADLPKNAPIKSIPQNLDNYINGKVEGARKALKMLKHNNNSSINVYKAQVFLSSLLDDGIKLCWLEQRAISKPLVEETTCLITEKQYFVSAEGDIGFCSLIYGNKSMYVGSYKEQGINFELIKKFMLDYGISLKKCLQCPFITKCSLCYGYGSIKNVKYRNPRYNKRLCGQEKEDIKKKFYVAYSILEAVPELEKYFLKKK